MGVWILHDLEQERAVLYCSVTERPFGPGFHEGSDSGEAAENFMRFLKKDPRSVSDSTLEVVHVEWFARTHCESCGHSVDFAEINSHEDYDDFMEAMGGFEASLKNCDFCPPPKTKSSPTLMVVKACGVPHCPICDPHPMPASSFTGYGSVLLDEIADEKQYREASLRHSRKVTL